MTYYISMTHEFYGNKTQVDLLGTDSFEGPMVFETRAEAEQEIERFDDTVYYLLQNEVGRPKLRVKTPSQLTARQREQLRSGIITR